MISSSPALLEISGLSAWYGAAQILFDLDLQVRRGEVVALMGRNGAGKSTTLNILGAMENNDKVALAVAFSTTLGGIMAIVKLAMGLWTMSVLFIVSAVHYAMLCVSRFSIVKSHTRTRQIADRVQRLTQEMSVYHRTGGLLCFIGLWMLLRRRWTVPASGEDSPDDAVPAVEITAETEA